MHEKINILIIDDSQGMRMVLAGILEYSGYNVVVAEDGYQGINEAKKLNFDVAFIDVRMPSKDGFETCREVKEISPGTTVIMMTGLDSDQCKDNVVYRDAFACISKPFDGAELLMLVDRAIGKEGGDDKIEQ